MSFSPIQRVLFAAALVAVTAPALAAPVSLGTVTRDYGQGASKITPTSNLSTNGPTYCDTVNSDSVTVRTRAAAAAAGIIANTSPLPFCQSFADRFNFSSFNYQSITSFILTIDYSDTNQTDELWRVRSAAGLISAPVATGLSTLITPSAANTQSFTFSSATLGGSLFNSIVIGGSYYLWFQNAGVGNSSFTLNSASLEVFGTRAEVPEPGSLALVGLALVGLVGLRRKGRSI